MRLSRIAGPAILAAVAAFLVVACDGNGGDGATTTPETTGTAALVLPTAGVAPTGDGAPTDGTQPTTDGPPDSGTSPTESGPPLVQPTLPPAGTTDPVGAAMLDLVERLEQDPGDIEEVSVTEMQWPDSCLGAPQDGEACAQVITPGFEVVLRVADTLYTYHTDRAGHVRLADFSIGG